MAFLNRRILLNTGLETYIDFVSSSKDGRRTTDPSPWLFTDAERGNFSDDSTYQSLGVFAHIEGDATIIFPLLVLGGFKND